MKLRTQLNLVVSALSAAFVVVLIAAEVQSTQQSVREEIEAANRVASQLLGQLASVYSKIGGPDLVLEFVRQLGRVRANEVYLVAPSGEVLYRAPAATYKAGREAPAWFARWFTPLSAKEVFMLRGGVQLVVEAQPSRAVLDAWDNIVRISIVGVAMLIIVNAAAFWLVARVFKPIPIIADGLERLQRGDLAFRLPPLAGSEAGVIGNAFNRMAQAVEDKVQAERQARDAEARLEERREMASLADQRVEEERRLIAHELHDEFGQSVTAIRSLALAIAAQGGSRDPATAEAALLISDEAARLYDAMHSLIPRLAPLTLDASVCRRPSKIWCATGSSGTRSISIDVKQRLPADLGPHVTLAIYRVVQEGLTNALRHARPLACRYRRRGRRAADSRCRWRMTAWDCPPTGRAPAIIGLRGLADRVTQLGGTLDVHNQLSRGVLLSADIPLEAPA